MQDECFAGSRYERRRPSKVLKIAESFTNLDETAKSGRFVRGPHSRIGRRFRDGERTKRVCCDDECDKESGVSEDCERVGDRRVTGSSCTALRTAVAALYPFDDFVPEKIGAGFFSEVFKNQILGICVRDVISHINCHYNWHLAYSHLLVWLVSA
ncbi:Serine/threonine protein kinase [Operophtera brumata]|uniref:Serine/threonine protein kinase n=1 Tax=Operophtera brumata TaxID=104452 RepID=A0A0L7KRT0_OPEBR|nr:Serine/threonine protein kinase [Operophtera brumata]KOB65761.1 Serine/threonine protein kinase [Operophtera brumata]